MGRWAQAQRRGSDSVLPAGLPPPPAPVCAAEGDDLSIFAQGDPDVGGSIEVDNGLSVDGPWSLYDTRAWDTTVTLTGVIVDPAGFWRAREVGNHVVYEGSSENSNVV